MIDDDLKDLSRCMERHRVVLGHRDDDSEQAIDCYGLNVLVAGTSGSGKSTITTGILERLAEQGYQFVVVDPEGDSMAITSSLETVGVRDTGWAALNRDPLEDRVEFTCPQCGTKGTKDEREDRARRITSRTASCRTWKAKERPAVAASTR